MDVHPSVSYTFIIIYIYTVECGTVLWKPTISHEWRARTRDSVGLQMESEQERFVHTMELLELEVAGLEQHEDLALVSRVAKLVGDISKRIGDAEKKCE